jgi:hypothetical protein
MIPSKNQGLSRHPAVFARNSLFLIEKYQGVFRTIPLFGNCSFPPGKHKTRKSKQSVQYKKLKTKLITI